MITSAELHTVTTSMQGIVDRGGLPPFDRIECDSVAREVIFLWEEPQRLAVIVEIDGDRSPEQQVDASLALEMSVN